MNTPQIRVKTEGFRAISSADIIIEGITVVAGENGSGKSTISKLLYYLYKTASNYDTLVAKALRATLQDVFRFLDIILHELYTSSKDKNTKEELRKDLVELRKSLLVETPDEEELDKWLKFLAKVEATYSADPRIIKDENRSANTRRRLNYILRDVVKRDNLENDENFFLPFEKITQLVEIRFNEAFRKTKFRPTSLFLDALRSVFPEGELPTKFEVLEFEDLIVSIDKSNLSIPYLIQNVIYIDTPMMIGIENTEIEYWEDLNEMLMKKGKANSPYLSQLISREIIKGDVSIDDNAISSNDFSFKRSDGSIYNLLEVATGVKSFAILQLLLKNGSLTDKTLLIIDEPEVHLHPQWIIEYARVLVLLNKQIGTKCFIASHNPDLVSALRYISEREGLYENLNFYLAERSEQNFLYNYRHLGKEIDPIFQSFNIAIERINQYGI